MLQWRKQMGAGLSDKMAGTIIPVLPVCVSGVPQVERKSVQRYFVVIGGDIWYTSNVAESDKLRI